MTQASESSVTNIPSTSVHQYHRPTEAQLRWAQFHHKKDAAKVRDRIEKMWLYPPSDNDDNCSAGDDSETEFSVTDGDDEKVEPRVLDDVNQKIRHKSSIDNSIIIISRGRKGVLRNSKMQYKQRTENLKKNGFRHPVDSSVSLQEGQYANQTSSRVFPECKVSAVDIANHLQQQQNFKRASARRSFDTTGGSGSLGDLKYIRRVGALKNPAPFLVSGQTPLDRGASWLHNLYLPNSTKASSSTAKGHSLRHSLDNPLYEIDEHNGSVNDAPMSCHESFIETPHQQLTISNKVNELDERIKKSQSEVSEQRPIARCVTDDDNSNVDDLRTPLSLVATTTASSEEFFHFQHLLGSYDDSFDEDGVKSSTNVHDTILFHREKALWTEFAELVPTVDACARNEIDEMNLDSDAEAMLNRSDNPLLVLESTNDSIECPHSNTIVEFTTSEQTSTVSNPSITQLKIDNFDNESLVEVSSNCLASDDKALPERHDVHVGGYLEAMNIVDNQEMAPMLDSIFHVSNESSDLKSLNGVEISMCHNAYVISAQANAFEASHETNNLVVENKELSNQKQQEHLAENTVLHVSSHNTNETYLSQANALVSRELGNSECVVPNECTHERVKKDLDWHDACQIAYSSLLTIGDGISPFRMTNIQSSSDFLVGAVDEKQLCIRPSEIVEDGSIHFADRSECNNCIAETGETDPLEDLKFKIGEQCCNLNLSRVDFMLGSVDPNESKNSVVSDHTDSDEGPMIKSLYAFVDGPHSPGPSGDLSRDQRSDFTNEKESFNDVSTKVIMSNSDTFFCGNQINDVDAGSVLSLINQMSSSQHSESVAVQSNITTIVNEGMEECTGSSGSSKGDESVNVTTEGSKSRSSQYGDDGVVLSLDESSNRSSCVSEVDIKQSQQSTALRKSDLVHKREKFPIVTKQKSRCYIPLNSTTYASKRVVATILESNPRWEKRFMM